MKKSPTRHDPCGMERIFGQIQRRLSTTWRMQFCHENKTVKKTKINQFQTNIEKTKKVKTKALVHKHLFKKETGEN